MYFLGMLAAVATPLPSLPDLATMISDQSFPIWALDKHAAATSYFHLEVNEAGQVLKCDIKAYKGDEKLANYICTLLLRHKVKPALDTSRRALPASYDTTLTMIVPSEESTTFLNTVFDRPSDIDVSVQQLPDGAKQAKLDVIAVIDERGKTQSCTALSDKDNPALIKAACNVANNFQAKPYLNASGQPQAYATRLTVRFMTDTPKFSGN